MHQILGQIVTCLENIVTQLRSSNPNDEPFGNAHGNWSFPGLTRAELIGEAQSIISLIREQGPDELGSSTKLINDYIRRLQFIQSNTIPNIWGSAGNGVPTYLLTLEGLRKALNPILSNNNQEKINTKLKKLGGQVRSMESRSGELEPRISSLATLLKQLEEARDTAEQLPTDLESLAEARQRIKQLSEDATTDKVHIQDVINLANKHSKALAESAEQAKSVLERCETAYSAATSVGLAAAFSERSIKLNRSIWFWIVGLVIALAAGSYLGYIRLKDLSNITKMTDISVVLVVINLFLSLLSVGAPVWFAWLSTKQIGQRFRLAEDYAFKASIARAYEGFRRETARFDKDMESKLLASALTRLDELPLRLVEADNHGTPWHELASSNLVNQAIRSVPGFTDKIKELASNSISAISTSKSRLSSTTKSPDIEE